MSLLLMCMKYFCKGASNIMYNYVKHLAIDKTHITSFYVYFTCRFSVIYCTGWPDHKRTATLHYTRPSLNLRYAHIAAKVSCNQTK